MIDLQQLPVGSVIRAVSWRPVNSNRRRAEDLQGGHQPLNSPVAGQKLNIESAGNPLALGSLLTAQVKGANPSHSSAERTPRSAASRRATGRPTQPPASLEGLFKALQGGTGAPRGCAAPRKTAGADTPNAATGRCQGTAGAAGGRVFEARAGRAGTAGHRVGLLRLLAQCQSSRQHAAGQRQAVLPWAGVAGHLRGKRWALWQTTSSARAGVPLPTRLPPGLEEEADPEMPLAAAAAVSGCRPSTVSLAQTQPPGRRPSHHPAAGVANARPARYRAAANQLQREEPKAGKERGELL